MPGEKTRVENGWVGPPAAPFAPEDGADLLGTADADVVCYQGLEEAPGPAGVVEDQGAGDFHLAHGELPEVPRRFVFSGERRRHHRGPAVEKALHVSRPEAVANGLEAGRLGAGGKAVGQLAEDEALTPGLALGPLVAVQPDLGRVGEIGADLDKAGAEAVVVDVEVVRPDAAFFFCELVADRTWGGGPVLGRTYPLELLGGHDGHDPTAPSASALSR